VIRNSRFVKVFVVLVVFGFGITVSLAAIPRATIRSSHAAPITVIASLGESGYFVTGGEDGKLNVWDPESDRLLRSIRVDRLPIRLVAPYPDGRRIAVYSSDGVGSDRISVWDWDDGTRRFLRRTNQEVLSLSVSPNGSYLVYTVPDIRSLVVLDADDGERIPFLSGNTGIIGWHLVGTSEERVVTYNPTNGELVYRGLAGGTVAGRFEAPRRLSMLTILGSRRYAAAIDEDGSLVVLNLLSGAITDTVRAGDVLGLHVDPENGDLVVHTLSFSGSQGIRRYGFSDGDLSQRFAQPRRIPPNVTVVLPTGRELFAGDDNGSILRWPAFESGPSTIARNRIEAVSDIYYAENRLHLLTSERVISISSDFFGIASEDRAETSYIRHRSVRLDAGPDSRFIPTGDIDLLLWTPGGNGDEAIREFRFYATRASELDFPYPRSIVSVDADDDSILFVSRTGRLQVLDRRTGIEEFSYPGIGLQTAILTRRGIFVGETEDGPIDSALLRLNIETGETVPLDTEAYLVFSLFYDERRARLFTIGLRRDGGGGVSTVIEVLEGVTFQRRRTILEVEGEYLSANIVVDPITGIAYTNLDDRGGIIRWDGVRSSELLRNPAHVPSRMVVAGDYLYTVNGDGTVSVIERYEGIPVMDYYVLGGTAGEWIAMQPDGAYVTSSERYADERTISVNDPRYSVESLALQLYSDTNGR